MAPLLHRAAIINKYNSNSGDNEELKVISCDALKGELNSI